MLCLRCAIQITERLLGPARFMSCIEPVSFNIRVSVFSLTWDLTASKDRVVSSRSSSVDRVYDSLRIAQLDFPLNHLLFSFDCAAFEVSNSICVSATSSAVNSTQFAYPPDPSDPTFHHGDTVNLNGRLPICLYLEASTI